MRGATAKAMRRAAADARARTIREARTKYRQAGRGLWRRLVSAIFGVLALTLLAAPAGAQVPVNALRYQRALTANARVVWGLRAPVAVLAAQVHQESGWNPGARSKFAGGLAQFTPATATAISARYPSELGANQPFNPSWALRALARYDRELFIVETPAASACDRWAFTLAAYNGGPGWITRDRRLAVERGADPARWWGQVERYSARAAWALAENRGYPRRILLTVQPRYVSWGGAVACRVESHV